MKAKGSVLVGMSGGVDSSVAAALLKRAGYEVIGVTMQIWHRSGQFEDAGAVQGCCTIDAVDDARRVASKLDIPYYVPNFREEMQHHVVDDFTREYLAGRTPNPCVRCNQFVRFDGLLARADELGIDYVATGHYARTAFDPSRNEFVLKTAIDSAKDQSYMLHTLQQRHLRRILFPLGDFVKSQTRALAAELGLQIANKPDSQEICFVAAKSYRDFLGQYGGVAPIKGEIVDSGGSVVGEHEGVHQFTVGQRRGLGIAAAKPRYVIELRPTENRVVVGDREEAAGYGLTCSRLSFTGQSPNESFSASVKIRYRSLGQPAFIQLVDNDEARVQFEQPVWGIAPGQLAVFYDGDRVIGGGTIDRALAAAS